MCLRVFINAIAIMAMYIFSPAASADVAKRELLACVTEPLHSEILGYATKKEHDSVRRMLASGQCVAIAPGATITILRPGILRATIEYKGTKYYTAADTIR